MIIKTEKEINRVIYKLNDLMDEEGRLNPEAYAEAQGAVNFAYWVLGESNEFDEWEEGEE